MEISGIPILSAHWTRTDEHGDSEQSTQSRYRTSNTTSGSVKHGGGWHLKCSLKCRRVIGKYLNSYAYPQALFADLNSDSFPMHRVDQTGSLSHM
jgi:hypothetical protein